MNLRSGPFDVRLPVLKTLAYAASTKGDGVAYCVVFVLIDVEDCFVFFGHGSSSMYAAAFVVWFWLRRTTKERTASELDDFETQMITTRTCPVRRIA